MDPNLQPTEPPQPDATDNSADSPGSVPDATPSSAPTEAAAPADSPADASPATGTPLPGPGGDDIDAQVAAAMGEESIEQLMAKDEAAQTQAAEPAEAPVEEEEPMHLEIRRGRISAIRGDDVFVDVTGADHKLQGVVPLAQFDRAPRLGSIMDFVVDHIDEAQGLMFLSREGAISRTTWDSLHKGSVVEARCTGSNKGGLELELVGSIRAFMPASQIDIHHVDDLTQFEGQKVEATVMEIDRKHKKVMLSRRVHIEHVRKQAKAKLMTTLKVGDVLDGKVSRVMPYGAFVDIGGVDGLVHVSDLSYSHVNNPNDEVKAGQEVKVKVLKIEADKDRIALGMKQVQPDPWDAVTATVHVGDEVTGRVVRTANFGAFIQVEQGVEALLPISEISWKRIHRAEDVISVGQSLRLKVLTLEPNKHRMSLSLKQLSGDPWSSATDRYTEGATVPGKVVNVQDFGAFVELEEGVEGLVHISELADRRVDQVTDIVNVGDEKEFRIKSIDPDNHKIALSLRSESAAKSGGPRKGDGDRRGGRKGGDKEQLHIKPAAKRIDKGDLKGGMDLGGIGLGGLSMDDLK